MKRRTLLVLLVLCTSSLVVLAQDQANFTQFYLNPYILNPSYAGIDGKTSASLIYRKQWMGIDGGPTVANFSLHTPINERLSTGLSLSNDKRGLISHTSLLFSAGYNVPVQEHSFVRFGLSIGGAWNTVDWNKLEGLSDPAIATLLDNHASLNGNAGISFHSKILHFGVTIPHIFQPSVVSEDGFTMSEVKPFESLVAHASTRFYFGEHRHVFEPYVIYRLNSTLPSQYEAAAVVHLNHIVWLGGSFKQDYGISALGGIKVKNMFGIGVSYSLPASGENQLNSPGFEVSLNYLMGVHKKGTVRYSFVDTHWEKEKKKKGTSASEAIAQKRKEEEANKKEAIAAAQKKREADAEKKRQALADAQAKKEAEALAKKQEAETLAKHQEEVKRRTEERKHEVLVAKEHPPEPAKDTAVNHNPRFRQEMNVPTQPMEGHHEHEQEQLTRLVVHAEDATDHHGEEGHPHAERHEYYKRGNHPKELPVSDYVVGGVFRSEPNAKHFSDGLDKLGFNTHYGHLTEKNLWYVYIIQTDDINKARAERDRVRKMKILKDAWLLTVHH